MNLNRFAAGGATAAIAAIAAIAVAPAGAGNVTFGPPSQLTQFGYCGGYEPGVAVDNFGNVLVTAHKQNHCDAAGVDPQASPVPARAASWMWTSKDNTNFTDMPGLSAGGVDTGADKLDFGDEGHMVSDGAGYIYDVDLKAADITFTAWKSTGPGKITEVSHLPVIGTGQRVTDRPWMAANSDGTLIGIFNTGSSAIYSSPAGAGSGRFTLYASHDHGATWDHLGITIPNSGWCYPAASHVKDSKTFVIGCTDDGNNLFAYVSTDDGATWTSHHVGPNSSLNSWPVAAIGPDGAMYVVQGDSAGTKGNTIMIYRSTDNGATWSGWNATPQRGALAPNHGNVWFDVASNGTLGLTYFLLPNTEPAGAKAGDYETYAGTSPGFGKPFTMGVANELKNPPGTKTGTAPWGDFLSCAFGPDNMLNVSWTGLNPLGTQAGQPAGALNSDILFAHQTS